MKILDTIYLVCDPKMIKIIELKFEKWQVMQRKVVNYYDIY